MLRDCQKYSADLKKWKQKELLEIKNVIVEKENLIMEGFPGGTVVKNPPANAGDTGSSPGPGRSHMPRSN